uniref:Uncharacterized protein n=1 Tax=Anopheles minimus TaxID=112268 RepID=A0A182VRW5_9DIPT
MSLYQDTPLPESVTTEPYSDWNDMCRTCLQPGISRSIFELDETVQLSYADKVMQCANVTIRAADNLPNQICTQCIEDLNVAYRFNLNCLEANALLQGSATFDCIEEKLPDLSPIVMPLETVPEDEDQIAIHLDTGVMYTYKPPVGLNVKLTHSIANSEKNSASSGNSTIMEETADGTTGEEVLTFDPLPDTSTTAQVSENDIIEYLVCMKDGGSDSDFLMPAIAETTEEPNFETEQTVADHSAGVENHSIGEEGIKTLQTIRKTNRPNEMKPTIEMVTSQPATDGTGLMFVIFVAKRSRIRTCSICGKRFSKSHHLKSHCNTHNNQTLIAKVEAKNETTVELQAETDSSKQDTTTVVYTELLQDELIASNDDEVHESNTLQPDDGVLVESYTDSTAAGLLVTDWPLVDGEKGEQCADTQHTETSAVTIVSEELENVSIVNFSDYIMKTAGLESFMVEDSVDGDPLDGRQLLGR